MNGTGGHDIRVWSELLDRKYKKKDRITREDFDRVLGNYTSCADWPCSLFAEELLQAYPEAKVILTVRDNVDVWYQSAFNTVWRFQRRKFYPETLSEYFWYYVIGTNQRTRFMRQILNYTPFGKFPTEGKQWYLDHNERLREIVPKERMLEFNAKEGWEPLCNFLGLEVPTCAYPSTNGSENFIKGCDQLWANYHMKKSRQWLRGLSLAMVALTFVFTLLGYREQGGVSAASSALLGIRILK